MKIPAWVPVTVILGITLLCFSLSGLLMSNLFSPVIVSSTPAFTQIPSYTPALLPTITFTATPTFAPGVTPTVTVSPTEEPSPTIALTSTQLVIPSPTITQTRIIGFTLVTLSSPVSVGGDAVAIIQTQPGVSCSIEYFAPSGSRSTAQGLEPTTADSNGNCGWTWKIGTRTAPGTGHVIITANGSTNTYPIEIT